MAVFDVDGHNISGSGSGSAFVDVTSFGAKGDGQTSDSTAIQSALNSLQTSGGIIFFPKGTYLITSSLLFYSNQTLWFENGAALLQGAAIDNLLRTYTESTWTGYNGVHDCLVYGGTFDGGAYTVNNTLVCTGHSKNIIFENCKFKNAYGTWHDLEINSSYNVKVINCDFEGSRKTGENGEMLQIDGATNSAYYPWPNFNIDSTTSKYIEVKGCFFHDSSVVPGVGNHSQMAHSFVKIHDCIFDGLTSSRGAIVFAGQITNVDIYDNIFNACTTGIASFGEQYFIHDNRFVDVETAAAWDSHDVFKNNMVNGTFVA